MSCDKPSHRLLQDLAADAVRLHHDPIDLLDDPLPVHSQRGDAPAASSVKAIEGGRGPRARGGRPPIHVWQAAHRIHLHVAPLILPSSVHKIHLRGSLRARAVAAHVSSESSPRSVPCPSDCRPCCSLPLFPHTVFVIVIWSNQHDMVPGRRGPVSLRSPKFRVAPPPFLTKRIVLSSLRQGATSQQDTLESQMELPRYGIYEFLDGEGPSILLRAVSTKLSSGNREQLVSGPRRQS